MTLWWLSFRAIHAVEACERELRRRCGAYLPSRGPITRFGGESDVTRLNSQSAGEDGSIVVTEKTRTEARVSVSVVHNRRKGKKDAWFNEGKVKRGETAARGIQIATPKRIFWGRSWSVLPGLFLVGVHFGNGVLSSGVS